MYVCMYVCMYELRSQGSRSSGRLRGRSGQSVPEAAKESVVLEEATIEDLTERRRMTVGERKELPFFLYSLITYVRTYVRTYITCIT